MMVCNNQDIEVDRGRTKGQENESKRAKERRNFSFILTIYVVYDKVIQHSALNTLRHTKTVSIHQPGVAGMYSCMCEWYELL